MLNFTRKDAIDGFNNKFKAGMQYMKQFDMSDAEIAEFLFDNKQSIDYVKLGECLGDKANIDVLKAYIKKFDFEGMDFTSALRIIMTDFAFPGEAQQIDRIMDTFGNHYYDSNKAHEDFEFRHPDAAYTLAFSCVMLNTDAHSPNVKNKMTFEQFKSNNRGMNGNGDFSEQFLEKIYRGITLAEIKRPKSSPSVSSEEELAEEFYDIDLNEDEKESALVTNYSKWKKSEGGHYKFGYLTWSALESVQNKFSTEEKLAEEPSDTDLNEKQENQEKSSALVTNYDSWKKSEGGNYKFGYLTRSVLDSVQTGFSFKS